MTQRQPDALTDATLERDIERALAVDPSPAFLPRVRAAIANEPVASRWWSAWSWVGAGSAAVAVTIAILMLRPSAPQPADLLAPQSLASQPVTAAVAPIVRAPEDHVRIVRPRRSPAVTAGVGRKPRAEPEVLIAKDEAAALKRLMRGIRRGVVEPSTPDEQLAGIQAIRPPGPIVVLPIAAMSPVIIEPLGSSAGEGGVRQ
jgi:hypothetical protein